METKPIYMIAGGTDGYVSIFYTFDYELACSACDNNPEMFGGFDGGIESLPVPADATYKSLGVTSLEDLGYGDEDELEDEDE